MTCRRERPPKGNIPFRVRIMIRDIDPCNGADGAALGGYATSCQNTPSVNAGSWCAHETEDQREFVDSFTGHEPGMERERNQWQLARKLKECVQACEWHSTINLKYSYRRFPNARNIPTCIYNAWPQLEISGRKLLSQRQKDMSQSRTCISHRFCGRHNIPDRLSFGRFWCSESGRKDYGRRVDL